MDRKEITLISLSIVAVIAIVGLVLLFKAQMEGGVVHSYPPTYYVKTIPQAVMELPSAAPYQDPMMQYSDTVICDQQARLNKIPKGYVWEAKTAQQRKLREAGNKQGICLDAPAGLPIVACCQPPKP